MANVTEQASCESCGAELPEQSGTGRKRRYCDATCRSAARRSRTLKPGVNQILTSDHRKAILDDVTGTQREDAAATPLDAVAAALRTVRSAEDDLRAAVESARSAGRSWAEIGDALGTSRQAAFQRFGRPIDPRTGASAARSVLPGAAEPAIGIIDAKVAGLWFRAPEDATAVGEG
jgi:hypothetical protein